MWQPTSWAQSLARESARTPALHTSYSLLPTLRCRQPPALSIHIYPLPPKNGQTRRTQRGGQISLILRVSRLSRASNNIDWQEQLKENRQDAKKIENVFAQSLGVLFFTPWRLGGYLYQPPRPDGEFSRMRLGKSNEGGGNIWVARDEPLVKGS